MSPTVVEKRRRLRRDLLSVQDPFELLADCIQRNEDLEEELERLRSLLKTGR